MVKIRHLSQKDWLRMKRKRAYERGEAPPKEPGELGEDFGLVIISASLALWCIIIWVAKAIFFG